MEKGTGLRVRREGTAGERRLDRRTFVRLAAVAGASCALGGCASGEEGRTARVAEPARPPVLSEAAPDPLAERVGRVLQSLTLEQKVSQLFAVRPEALTREDAVLEAGDALLQALAQRPVGGVVYFGKNIAGAEQFRALVAGVAGADVPVAPFSCIDEEGGPLVARVANSGQFDVPAFPAMAEIGAAGDPAAAYEAGAAIGGYLADLGLDVDFAPVADVLTNPQSSIGSRAFSDDPQVAAAMVAQAVAGLQGAGVSACAKHFPGHGDAAADSHTGAAVSERTLDELRSCEFVPFKAAIDAGVDLVMVGHISTPNAAADGLPASLSPTAIGGWLRGELGFSGVVTSDSLDMGAVTDFYTADQAAVLFLKAGGDLVLDPADFDLAYQGVLDAVGSGELTEARVDESVRRILKVKLA